MSHLVETEQAIGGEHLIFPCECGAGCYLRVVWDDGDRQWRYLWIESWQQPQGWSRLSAAWRLLRGRPHQHTDVVLGPETIAALSGWLASKNEVSS